MSVMDRAELTQYDEFPIHQYSRPFSEVPTTDTAWDDGYFTTAFSPTQGLFLLSVMRVNPNMDVIGGAISIAYRGRQYVVRFSRRWRTDCDTHIGPYRYRFVEPFRDIHITLDANESPVSFDLHWLGQAPAFLESQHFARVGGRILNDQSRYIQVGAPVGWIDIAGERIAVDSETWSGARDHSWGIYQKRAPLAPDARFMPPPPPPSGRSLRFWTMFKMPTYSGFFGVIEDKDGMSRSFNDWLGSNPFQGVIDFGWDRRLELASASHELTFVPGTRTLTGGRLQVVDTEGGTWTQEFECGTPPFLPVPAGYWVGSWDDGGTLQTYHGEGPVLEWQEIDISKMPMDYQTVAGPLFKNAHSLMYGARLKMTDPLGNVSEGQQHITFWVEGEYTRYGFTDGVFP